MKYLIIILSWKLYNGSETIQTRFYNFPAIWTVTVSFSFEFGNKMRLDHCFGFQHSRFLQ